MDSTRDRQFHKIMFERGKRDDETEEALGGDEGEAETVFSFRDFFRRIVTSFVQTAETLLGGMWPEEPKTRRLTFPLGLMEIHVMDP